MIIMVDKTTVYALGQHISMSVHKARRVIDQIRGRSYKETLMILNLMPYRACYPIFKLVCSAAANASSILGSSEAHLLIWKAEVNEGTTMKRLKLRARGHSYQIKRQTCHITIVMKDVRLPRNYAMKDITYSKYGDIVFLQTEKFQKNADKFLAIDSMEEFKKPNRKNLYRVLEDHDRYSNGGLWDKK
uniref:Large ribosomal subunit protein uL22c n=1 Tax=Lobelia heterophylla subsp. heterophylla TaxID=2041129 RepID=A0A291EYF3_9ASTR|nr:ribosomal protein L22 [Lobelia heterophylla subsp. heterophylla]